MADNSFLGKGWSFPPEFRRKDSPVEMVSDEEDIRQSLFILFSTRKGERFNRQYGCGLDEFVHEPMNKGILTSMEDRIKRSVILYEPRIILEKVVFDQSKESEGVLLIELTYRIRQTNRLDNMVYPFYLEVNS